MNATAAFLWWIKRTKRLHLLILFIFFSCPFCKSNLSHQKRKICFLMLWFFFLTKLNHSALCVCWYTWHSAKHVNPHKLTFSYLSPLHEGVALPCVSLAVMLWEGGAAAVHLCHCAAHASQTLEDLRNLTLGFATFGAIWSCFEGGEKTKMWDVTLAAAVLLMCERRYSLRLRKDL